MPILIDNPHELGADRLVNAVAAHDRVDGACVTVDFGTRRTSTSSPSEGEYLGGVIGPGVEISLEALTDRTAKLPRIDVRAPARRSERTRSPRSSPASPTDSPGSSTASPPASARSWAAPARVIATGGLARTIAPHCETVDEVDPLLTLRGLRLIHELNA